MSVEAMKQALEAFEDILSAESRGFGMEYIKGYCVTMIRGLRPAIKQAENKKAHENLRAALKFHEEFRMPPMEKNT